MDLLIRNLIVEHEHGSRRGPFGQRKGAFSDPVISDLVVFNIPKTLVYLQSCSGIEFHIVFNCAQNISSPFCLKCSDILMGSFNEVFELSMVFHEPDIDMLRYGHVLYQMECGAEIKEGLVKISAVPAAYGVGVIIHCKIQGVASAVKSSFFLYGW